MKKLCFITILLCILAASCRSATQETGRPLPDQPPPEETAPLSPTPPGEVYTPKLLVEEDFWQQDYYADDGALLLRVSCVWPKLSEDFATVLRADFGNRRDEIQQQAETYLSAAREAYGHQPDDFVPHSWTQNFTVERNDGIYLSIVFEDARYSGGVHESETVETRTIRLDDGASVSTLDDLFTVDRATYIARLAPLIRSQIAPYAEDYFPNYDELVEELFPSGTFCLTDTGLALFFQPYQLAPYTQGVCRFDLSQEAFADIWKG